MSTTMSIPRRLPLLMVQDNVLLPGSSMRIPVRNVRNMNMVKSHLLSRNTLSSTIIGVIPREPVDEDKDNEELLGLILDPSTVCMLEENSDSEETQIFSLARGLCYALHVQRNTLLASV